MEIKQGDFSDEFSRSNGCSNLYPAGSKNPSGQEFYHKNGYTPEIP
jgi:hypothetical protein